MQIEPFEEEDGYRVWLNRDEQEQLINHFSEEPRKQIAVRAMLHGLRSDELRHLQIRNIRRLNSDDEAYKLRVRDGKTGWREVPISVKLKEQMNMLKNARGLRKDDPLIDVTTRTVQRWLESAGEDLANQTENEDWQYVRPHDLRRSWATTTYYKLDSHYAVDIIMRWGGWSSRDVFTDNYLGRETDAMASEMMTQADLR